MTKQEIAEIIESKGNEYGFKMRDMGPAWTSEQTSESNIRIELFKETDYDNTRWEDHRVAINLKVTGCICRMGDRRGGGGTSENRRGDCKGHQDGSRH